MGHTVLSPLGGEKHKRPLYFRIYRLSMLILVGAVLAFMAASRLTGNDADTPAESSQPPARVVEAPRTAAVEPDTNAQSGSINVNGMGTSVTANGRESPRTASRPASPATNTERSWPLSTSKRASRPTSDRRSTGPRSRTNA